MDFKKLKEQVNLTDSSLAIIVAIITLATLVYKFCNPAKPDSPTTQQSITNIYTSSNTNPISRNAKTQNAITEKNEIIKPLSENALKQVNPPLKGLMILGSVNNRFDQVFSSKIGGIMQSKFNGQELMFGQKFDNACFNSAVDGDIECILNKKFVQGIRYLILVENIDNYDMAAISKNAVTLSSSYKIAVIDVKKKRITNIYGWPLFISTGNKKGLKEELEKSFLDSLEKKPFII